MSQEHCSQNHRYLSNCVNLGSLLVIVMLITYLEQCSATQLQNTTTAGHDCWFNWTQILDGHILGLETPLRRSELHQRHFDTCRLQHHKAKKRGWLRA
ncbi:hypothetical protein MRX96_022268 [Rhipicephalus microplus]